MSIHPTAVIEPSAKLGKNVTVGAFTYIARDVEIGDNCIISPHVTILPYTRLGEACEVHSGAILGDTPQDFAYQDAKSYVVVGDRCQLREGVTIHRGTKPDTVTRVGDDCLLMGFSHLAHNVCIGDRVVISNGALIAGYAEVGDRAFISGNSLVHQFTRIGRLAMLSGGTATHKDVLPFCMTHTLSRSSVMGLNVVGLQRAGFSDTERLLLRRAFKRLYQSHLNTSQAVAKLAQEFDSPLVQEWCNFIQSSSRGICRMAHSVN
ncbi:MAG: acyl-ACP--UDP-N-acetylglucosamine O-acyltransferase [Jaaginema sp. PMC 1079.18]|nr:acyl-ACP--UDP-N-acetylglucosamine O-acyltransferase [Jaaginema sp. PMC 1080.18]MEC4850950.1 acyl-ACP--UDP-N-acetylglucosamine O-acyltransferase [Jaaginema sp. PMC 1079.18]MEC4867070.1 acyl-ACP--UDP-N-acetylglucosamine O-acyltransferase [Jaaginema sp. PMC 1078.18]